MAELNAKSVEKFPVLVPPPNEQRAIVERIAPFNDVIASETAHLVKLRNQKQVLMQDLLTGRVSVEHLVPESANA